MAETMLTGGNIANIERIKITTEETTPKTYVINTATSLSYTPVVSAGAETDLRVKNTLHGLLRTEDIVKGYDLEFEDELLHPQILALVDGGTISGSAGEAGETYTAPVIGTPVSRVPFTMTAYTSDRDTSGDAVAYHAWEFEHCKGKPVQGTHTDNAFAKMKYQLYNRPASGDAPFTLERIAALPSTST